MSASTLYRHVLYTWIHALFPVSSCRLRSSLHFIHWNQEGWKTGLCSAPPVGQVTAFGREMIGGAVLSAKW